MAVITNQSFHYGVVYEYFYYKGLIRGREGGRCREVTDQNNRHEVNCVAKEDKKLPSCVCGSSLVCNIN